MRRSLIALLAVAPLTARAADLPSYEARYELRLIHASETGGPRAMSGDY